MVLLTVVVGVANANVLVPSAEPCGVDAAVLTQLAVAVLVPLLDVGAELYVQQLHSHLLLATLEHTK